MGQLQTRWFVRPSRPPQFTSLSHSTGYGSRDVDFGQPHLCMFGRPTMNVRKFTLAVAPVVALTIISAISLVFLPNNVIASLANLVFPFWAGGRVFGVERSFGWAAIGGATIGVTILLLIIGDSLFGNAQQPNADTGTIILVAISFLLGYAVCGALGGLMRRYSLD
jgi:hypothetical protein